MNSGRETFAPAEFGMEYKSADYADFTDFFSASAASDDEKSLQPCRGKSKI
jgi:hypothetical protein